MKRRGVVLLGRAVAGVIVGAGVWAGAGCTGGHGSRPDAAADAEVVDAPPPDANPCGAERFVTGELVDFDSTHAQFKGVLGAKLSVEGMPARTTTTAPSGRFELCAPAGIGAMTFDLDVPGAYLDGKVYITEAALGGRRLSFRALTQARASALYAFDASRGHVLVFLAGDRASLTLSGAHGPPLAGNGDEATGVFTWAPGDVGRYVLFPNVDVSSPTVMLAGDITGPHPIPVAAGTLTLVAISFVFR